MSKEYKFDYADFQATVSLYNSYTTVTLLKYGYDRNKLRSWMTEDSYCVYLLLDDSIDEGQVVGCEFDFADVESEFPVYSSIALEHLDWNPHSVKDVLAFSESLMEDRATIDIDIVAPDFSGYARCHKGNPDGGSVVISLLTTKYKNPVYGKTTPTDHACLQWVYDRSHKKSCVGIFIYYQFHDEITDELLEDVHSALGWDKDSLKEMLFDALNLLEPHYFDRIGGLEVTAHKTEAGVNATIIRETYCPEEMERKKVDGYKDIWWRIDDQGGIAGFDLARIGTMNEALRYAVLLKENTNWDAKTIDDILRTIGSFADKRPAKQ